MAGARKLQNEIDTCLRAVTEGLRIFDDGARKVDLCDNPALKAKLEDNLKRELKKLQKFRDSIKGWAASTEVKEKGKLEEGRASIETRMERFKIIERESKMKAYSKEGLARDTPLTPEDRKRLKTREWVDKFGASAATTRDHGAAYARACVRRGRSTPSPPRIPSPLHRQLTSSRTRWRSTRRSSRGRRLRPATAAGRRRAQSSSGRRRFVCSEHVHARAGGRGGGGVCALPTLTRIPRPYTFSQEIIGGYIRTHRWHIENLEMLSKALADNDPDLDLDTVDSLQGAHRT